MNLEHIDEKENKPAIVIPAHNLVEMDSVHFGEAVKNDFGIEVREIQKVTSGFQNQVYKATTIEGKTVFIRINKESRAFESELFGYQAFKEAGIPVPEVIAYQENPPTISHPTMIMNEARGVSLDESRLSPEQEKAVYEDLGNTVRRINEIKMEGFGPIKMVDGKPRSKFQRYEEYCEWWKKSLSEAVDFLISNNLITREEAEKIFKIFEEISALKIKQSFLLHRDIHGKHVFIEDGKITGIIDLGRLQTGDPRYEIGKTLIFQNRSQQEHFKRGYGELANDGSVLKYLAITATTKAMFRTKSKRDGSAEKTLLLLKKILSEL